MGHTSKCKTIKLQDNVGEYLGDLKYGNDFRFCTENNWQAGLY
jgi:hypothetical protein